MDGELSLVDVESSVGVMNIRQLHLPLSFVHVQRLLESDLVVAIGVVRKLAEARIGGERVRQRRWQRRD